MAALCGIGDATDDILMTSLSLAPDSSVEFRTPSVLFRAGPSASVELPTKKCQILRTRNPKGEFGS